MPYLPLGKVTTPTAPDNTGLNVGNLTTAFTQAVLNVKVAWYEIYHAVVTNVPPGASAVVNVGSSQYSFTYPFGGSEWDPSQPLLLGVGQEVYFLWNLANTVTQLPVVTLWERYDPTLTGNQGNALWAGLTR
jgi:hypothetical protein